MLRPRGLSGVSGQEELQARDPAQHFSMMPREGRHVRLGESAGRGGEPRPGGESGEGDRQRFCTPCSGPIPPVNFTWQPPGGALELRSQRISHPQRPASSCLFWALHLPAWERVVPGLCLGGVMSGH